MSNVLLERRRKLLALGEAQPIDYTMVPFTLVALENAQLKIEETNANHSLNNVYINVNKGGITSAQFDVLISFSAGDRIEIYGDGAWSVGGSKGLTFVMLDADGNYADDRPLFDAYGNIMSLYYNQNFIGQTSVPAYAFTYIFSDADLGDISGIRIPATSVGAMALAYTFEYNSFLNGYIELPAMTLGNECYEYMFHYCTSLTTPPLLPATTLKTRCYQYMFGYCTSLNYIKCLARIRTTTGCTDNWVTNVAASGTFVKATNATWSTGQSGIPNGWTVVDAT